jgi:hypothetical protein
MAAGRANYGRILGMDWAAWHAAYGDPSSPLTGRLRQVGQWLSEAFDRAPPGPVRLVSLCAGQGRDVIGVLPGHPRRDDVRAVLVEADPLLAEAARGAAAEAGLAQVEVREADAAAVASFADALPADVLLLCGIFGNVSRGTHIRAGLSAMLSHADGVGPSSRTGRECEPTGTGLDAFLVSWSATTIVSLASRVGASGLRRHQRYFVRPGAVVPGV